MLSSTGTGAKSSTADGGRRFRPGATLTVLVLVALAVLLSLGTWQVRRLAWKTALIETITSRGAEPAIPVEQALDDPAANDFRHVGAAGRYRHDLAFAMGTVAERGEVGGRLVTPLLLPDGRAVLVERGWLPERLLPPGTPEAIQPSGQVELDGVARFHGGDRAGVFTPDNRPEQRRWYWYDLAGLRAALGLEVEPLVLALGRSDTGGALPQPLPVRADLPNNHLGYAITWYGLAIALVAVYVAFGLKRGGA
ncbi:MAG TPA: SURF1 family protein [Geminicoccaceae bacterium]|nr:SURF1 family protein [Geminicoccus sp.]HMU49584.1 SURF1 family protein [Geminicoccaceae bacterium]